MAPKSFIIAVLVSILAVSASWAAEPAAPAPQVQFQTKKHILENGMTVLVTEMPSSSTVALYALVKTGSATEGKWLGTGVSHFLEHMLFKGTLKRKVGEIPKEIQALGGVVNASTSFDYTIYTITVPHAAFSQALDVLSDMLMHSQFDPQEIQKEREVVYGEMRLYKDRPDRYLSQLVFSTVYQKHPYSLPIIGFEELLRPLTREDFLAYYQERYIPNNIILTVSGKVDDRLVLVQVTEAFKDFKRQRYVVRNLPEEPKQISPRYYEETYPTEITRLSLSYAGVSILDNDMFALDVLAMILGEGETARLYQELFKKQQLVRTITASNWTPLDPGVFEIECSLDDVNLEKVVAAIDDQVQRVRKEGVGSAELARAKQQVLSRYIFDQQTADQVAYNTAIDEAILGDHDFAKKYVQSIAQVSLEDIKRVAQRYFQEQTRSIVVLRPQKDGAEENAAAKIENIEQPIEKIVLPNGLKVLLRENHVFPLVSINLAVGGGQRQEPETLLGLSELTSHLWIKGTRTRTTMQIAESVAALGAGLGGFSGKSSLGININLLSKDLSFGVDLLEDLVKNPTFPQTELDKIKAEMKTGILVRDDNIAQQTTIALKETLFQTHPLRRDPLGTMATVEAIRREDVLNYFQKFGVPNNAVLSVFGDFDSVALRGVLEKKFSALKASDVPRDKFSEPPPEATREKTLQLDKAQAMVAVGFPAPGYLDSQRYGVELMTSILGSAFNGRIFTRIRDELGLAYTLGGGFTSSVDAGMIYFYVLTTDQNLEKAKTTLLDLIRELGTSYVSDEELSNMKSYLKGTFQMGIETNSELGFMTALDELYGAGFDNYARHDNLIDQITKDEVKQLAQQYLDINKAAVVLTRPKNPNLGADIVPR